MGLLKHTHVQKQHIWAKDKDFPVDKTTTPIKFGKDWELFICIDFQLLQTSVKRAHAHTFIASLFILFFIYDFYTRVKHNGT